MEVSKDLWSKEMRNLANEHNGCYNVNWLLCTTNCTVAGYRDNWKVHQTKLIRLGNLKSVVQAQHLKVWKYGA